jgi:hypothetical protein
MGVVEETNLAETADELVDELVDELEIRGINPNGVRVTARTDEIWVYPLTDGVNFKLESALFNIADGREWEIEAGKRSGFVVLP